MVWRETLYTILVKRGSLLFSQTSLTSVVAFSFARSPNTPWQNYLWGGRGSWCGHSPLSWYVRLQALPMLRMINTASDVSRIPSCAWRPECIMSMRVFKKWLTRVLWLKSWRRLIKKNGITCLFQNHMKDSGLYMLEFGFLIFSEKR